MSSSPPASAGSALSPSRLSCSTAARSARVARAGDRRARPDLRRARRRDTRPKRPDTAHGLPEQTRLVGLLVRVLIAWGSHASSVARLSDSIVTRTFGGSIPYAVKILVSNDDGFRAEGIRRLREALATLAEVTVLAPARKKSGAGN